MSDRTRRSSGLPRDETAALRRLRRHGLGSISGRGVARPLRVDRAGRLGLETTGALGVDAFGRLILRTGDGLEQTPGSPKALRLRTQLPLRIDSAGRVGLSADTIRRLLPEKPIDGELLLWQNGHLRPYRDGTSGQALRKQSDGTWAAQALPVVVTDHGGLTGLSDDDHPQYALDSDLAAYALISTLTTKGDLFVYTGSALTRLSVGADGAPLVGDSAASRGVSYVTNGLQYVVPFQVLANASATWASQPAAATFFMGDDRHVQLADLSPYTHARLLVKKEGTAANAGALLKLKYRTAFSATVTDYSDVAGSGSIQVAIDAADTYLSSAWTAMASGAKADVYLCLEGTGGNGAISPSFGNIVAQFRRSA